MDKFGVHNPSSVLLESDAISAASYETLSFVNVEKEPPFATSIVEVGEKLIEYGTEVVNRHCRNTEAEKQQDYSTGWPPVHVANDLLVGLPKNTRRKTCQISRI